ncbi:hypothetical protein E1176_14365 [Fulvivirga sp. RKSG066]|uniref:hypothetical protein n=1 Tax=Fulvivirga aurantia TaxID=2529383 RepID=UPI0012BCD36D|nr:hypothetical protein [Fulvivirga aurantia]MTI22212.1 hypothetical protein [Fulvivirga aurantia]
MTIRKTLTLILITLSVAAMAQRPGGRPGGGPEEMVKREKQSLYEKVDDLSEDQKLLLDGIYDEFLVTLKENFEEMRQGGDRESRRAKMEALRKEKDTLIQDVLNEEQFEVYQTISAPRRGRNQKEDGDTQG